MNVDEYLAHINYKGSLEPTLSTLTDLLQCHKQTIPYTNIDAIITKRWRLDPTDFYKQVIKNKGGGTCIDINYMFSCFLEKVGFKTIFLPSCFYIDSSEQWSELYGHVFVAVSKSNSIMAIEQRCRLASWYGSWVCIPPNSVVIDLSYGSYLIS